MSHVEGPDFLCVGMPRSGTGWLYDQLQFHPDFWMTPVKELHYFDGPFPGDSIEHYIHIVKAMPPERLAKRLERGGRRKLDERDLLFLENAKACRQRGVNFDDYKKLFESKGNLVSGDVTPAYGGLPDETIAAIGAALPEAKIVLMVREPIARAWSRMLMRQRKLGGTNRFDDLLRFREVLDKPNFKDLGCPTRIVERWSRYFPGDRFRHFFFDDLQKEPDQLAGSIVAYLGGNPDRKAEVPADFNRKEERQAKSNIEMSGEMRDILIDVFADEIRACAQMFGGPAKDWPARYGLQ